MDFEMAGRTHVGLKRSVNEDNLLLRPELGLFVVADGMGGHEAGDVASARVMEAMQGIKPDGADLIGQIEASLHGANHDLRELAGGERSRKVIGSTVAGLLIDDEGYRCFWAGDSRVYRLRQGQLSQVSRDHSLVQELVDAGMLEEEQAPHHPNGNMITRAVGAADELRLEVVDGTIEPGDCFLLATDGITRVVTDGELTRTLADERSLNEAADGLVWTVLSRGAPDNLTVILLRVGG